MIKYSCCASKTAGGSVEP